MLYLICTILEKKALNNSHQRAIKHKLIPDFFWQFQGTRGSLVNLFTCLEFLHEYNFCTFTNTSQT